VKSVLRRLRAAGHGRKAAPLFVFDVGYSAAALAGGLLGCPVHILVRLAAGSVFYAEPVAWQNLPVLPGTVIHVTVERLPGGRDPHRAMWLWHAGPGPLSLDELWRACLARFGIEHAFRLLKGALGLTAAKVRAPEQADRWARLLMAACAQLLPARPPGRRSPPPPGKHPDPARPLPPGRVRRGFRNIRRDLGTPARVAKPARPGPGRPKGSTKGPATCYLLPAPRRSRHAAHSKSGADQGKG
jgi:hypothetical protein